MSRQPADRPRSVRVAVVGAATPAGLHLRDALAERGVPGASVDLYGNSQGEAVLSEYDGEARLVQEPHSVEGAGHEVLFLCERGEASRKVAGAIRPGTLVVDLVACLDDGERLPRVHMDINPEAAQGRRLAVPHPLSILLADLLRPLDRELGVEEAVAVILRPAIDFGRDGVEELRGQTVGLLNFGQVPSEVFGRQLAFNVIPQAGLAGEERRLEERIRLDVMEVLGWERGRLALRMLAVPVFYGHCLQLRLRFRSAATPQGIGRALQGATVALPGDAEARSTPVDVSEERTTSFYEIAEDGLGGYWLLAVAGETERRGAEHAVRRAAALAGL